jgi:hypothetical protein
MSAVRTLDEDVTTNGLLLGDSLLHLVDIGEGAIWLLAILCRAECGVANSSSIEATLVASPSPKSTSMLWANRSPLSAGT